MRFRLTENYFVPGARPSTVWTTKDLPPADAEYIAAEVGDERRMLLGRVARMAAEFNQTIVRRVALCHDCGVFALACLRDDPFDNLKFYEPGGYHATMLCEDNPLPNPMQPPEIQPGNVLVGVEDDQVVHAMVRASTDEKDPLYFTKFGPGSPVVLTTLQQNLDCYPAIRELLPCEEISLVPISPPTAE